MAKTYMKLKVHEDTLNTHVSASGKAIYFDVLRDSAWRTIDHVWFPMSQLIISDEANEVGYHDIMIPYWLIKREHITSALQFADLGFDSGADTVVTI